MKPYAAPFVLVLIGALVAWSGASLPAYTDPEWNSGFDGAEVSMENRGELSDRWFAAKAAVETSRHGRLDLGLGLVALGASVSVLLAFGRVRHVGDLATMQRPGTRRGFYTAASVTWLSFVPAEWWWLSHTQSRGDYPPWADTIAIPAGGALFLGMLGLPVVLAGVAVALRGATLPVPLWSGPVVGRPYFVCVGIIAAIGLAILMLILSVSLQPTHVPSAVFTLYLLLSGRAAAAVGGRA